MDAGVSVEFGPNPGNPPVHHVRRRHHVGTGLRVAQRLFGEYLQGFIVENVAARIVGSMSPSWPWLVVRVERHIGNEPQLRKSCLHGACKTRGTRPPGCRPPPPRRFRPARPPGTAPAPAPRDAASATRRSPSSEWRLTPGIEATGCAFAGTFDHEYRVDQVVGRQAVLAHQATREIIALHAAHPCGGKSRVGLMLFCVLAN